MNNNDERDYAEEAYNAQLLREDGEPECPFCADGTCTSLESEE